MLPLSKPIQSNVPKHSATPPAFSKLPAAAVDTISRCLEPADQNAYALMNRYTQNTVQQLRRARLLQQAGSADTTAPAAMIAPGLPAVPTGALEARIPSDREGLEQQIAAALASPDLAAHVKTALGDGFIKELLLDGELTLSDLAFLSNRELDILGRTSVRKYVSNGFLSVADAVRLTLVQLQNLSRPAVQKYIDGWMLSKEALLSMTARGGGMLGNHLVQIAIETGQYDISFFMGLGADTTLVFAVNSPGHPPSVCQVVD